MSVHGGAPQSVLSVIDSLLQSIPSFDLRADGARLIFGPAPRNALREYTKSLEGKRGVLAIWNCHTTELQNIRMNEFYNILAANCHCSGWKLLAPDAEAFIVMCKVDKPSLNKEDPVEHLLTKKMMVVKRKDEVNKEFIREHLLPLIIKDDGVSGPAASPHLKLYIGLVDSVPQFAVIGSHNASRSSWGLDHPTLNSTFNGETKEIQCYECESEPSSWEVSVFLPKNLMSLLRMDHSDSKFSSQAVDDRQGLRFTLPAAADSKALLETMLAGVGEDGRIIVPGGAGAASAVSSSSGSASGFASAYGFASASAPASAYGFGSAAALPDRIEINHKRNQKFDEKTYNRAQSYVEQRGLSLQDAYQLIQNEAADATFGKKRPASALTDSQDDDLKAAMSASLEDRRKEDERNRRVGQLNADIRGVLEYLGTLDMENGGLPYGPAKMSARQPGHTALGIGRPEVVDLTLD